MLLRHYWTLKVFILHTASCILPDSTATYIYITFKSTILKIIFLWEFQKESLLTYFTEYSKHEARPFSITFNNFRRVEEFLGVRSKYFRREGGSLRYIAFDSRWHLKNMQHNLLRDVFVCGYSWYLL